MTAPGTELRGWHKQSLTAAEGIFKAVASRGGKSRSNWKRGIGRGLVVADGMELKTRPDLVEEGEGETEANRG